MYIASYISQTEILMKLIFETFEYPKTLILKNIKSLIASYNGTLYIGIDFRRMQFFKNIIFEMHVYTYMNGYSNFRILLHS